MYVTNKLGLTTINVTQTKFYDRIPWKYVHHKLKQYLRNISVIATIYKALVKYKIKSERKN